ncbi:MAG: CoA-binding protein [Bacteroidales bacterium]
MKENKKTIVLGVSPDPQKRAHRVCKKLLEKGHTIVPLGIRPGYVNNIPIITDISTAEEVHTVIIYLRASRQKSWLPYILASKPRRIIFNPGSENPELIELAKERKIDILYECALLMLSSNRY